MSSVAGCDAALASEDANGAAVLAEAEAVEAKLAACASAEEESVARAVSTAANSAAAAAKSDAAKVALRADQAAAFASKRQAEAARATATAEAATMIAENDAILAVESAAAAETLKAIAAEKLNAARHATTCAATAAIRATVSIEASAASAAAVNVANDNLTEITRLISLSDLESDDAESSSAVLTMHAQQPASAVCLAWFSEEQDPKLRLLEPENSRQPRKDASLPSKHLFSCASKGCNMHSNTFYEYCASLAMGMPLCIKCIRLLPPGGLLKVMTAKQDRPLDSSTIRVFGLDIGTVHGKPSAVWSIAAVSFHGLESFVIEKNREKMKDLDALWTCVITNSVGVKTIRESKWPQPIVQLINYLKAVSGNKPEDLCLVTFNGAGFDLPILLEHCRKECILMPNFSVLDARVLSFMRTDPRYGNHDLFSIHKAMFLQADLYRYKPFAGARWDAHTSDGDARMTLMVSWHLIAPDPGATAWATRLQELDLTPEIKERFIIMSTSMNEYARYLRPCLDAMNKEMTGKRK